MYKSQSLTELDAKSAHLKPRRSLQPLSIRSVAKSGNVTPITEIDLDACTDNESVPMSGFLDMSQQQFIEDLLVDKINLKREMKGLQGRLSDALKVQPKTILGGQFKFGHTAQVTSSPTIPLTDETFRAALKLKQKMLRDVSRERDSAQQELANAKGDVLQLMTANADMQEEMDRFQGDFANLNEQLEKQEMYASSFKATIKHLRSERKELLNHIAELDEEQSSSQKKCDELLAREESQRAEMLQTLQSLDDEKRKTETLRASALEECNMERMQIRATLRHKCEWLLRPTLDDANLCFLAWRLIVAASKSTRALDIEAEARHREQIAEQEMLYEQKLEEAVRHRRTLLDEHRGMLKDMEKRLTAEALEKEAAYAELWARRLEAVQLECFEEAMALNEQNARSKAERDDARAAADEKSAKLDIALRKIDSQEAARKHEMAALQADRDELAQQLQCSSAEVETCKKELQETEKENGKHRARYTELMELVSDAENKDVRIKREQTLLKEIRQLREELDALRAASAPANQGVDEGTKSSRALPRQDVLLGGGKALKPKIR